MTNEIVSAKHIDIRAEIARVQSELVCFRVSGFCPPSLGRRSMRSSRPSTLIGLG